MMHHVPGSPEHAFLHVSFAVGTLSGVLAQAQHEGRHPIAEELKTCLLELMVSTLLLAETVGLDLIAACNDARADAMLTKGAA